MDPKAPSPDEPRPSVDDLGLTTPSTGTDVPIVSPSGDIIQPTQPLEGVFSPDSHESLDLSQLDPPVTTDNPVQPEEQLVKPAPPTQPRSMPAFMQQPKQSSTSNTTTTVTRNYSSAPPPPSSTATPPPQAPLASSPQQTVIVKKSHTLLIVGIIIIILVLIGGAAFLFLKDRQSRGTSTATTSSDSQTDAQTDTASQTPTEASIANATVAKSLRDFDAVCKKGSISNAADYTSNKTAVIYGLYNSPATPDYWSSTAVGYDKSYYPGTDEYQNVSVVACLAYIDGSPSTSKQCEYTDKTNKTVAITYTSTKYSLAFYEAKTGKRISEGQDINGPATTCPSIITYDQNTKVAYAQPDTNAIEAAFDTFVK